MEIREFQWSHLAELDPPVILPPILPYLPAQSIFDGGKAVCCFGLIPRDGRRYEAWAFFSYGWTIHLLAIVRIFRKFAKVAFDVYNMEALEADGEFEKARRLLKVIGFKKNMFGRFEYRKEETS